MQSNIKKALSKFLLVTLLVSNLASPFIVNADKDNNNWNNGNSDHKITICHVPPGNESNPQTITVDKHSWEWENGNKHSEHSTDYIWPCLEPSINIEKSIASEQYSSGQYFVTYNIDIINNWPIWRYDLSDSIDLPAWVTADVTWVAFVDDDSEALPSVNPSFNWQDQTSIIQNELILSWSTDSFQYKVIYTISQDTIPSTNYCSWSIVWDNKIINLKNNASINYNPLNQWDAIVNNSNTCTDSPIPVPVIILPTSLPEATPACEDGKRYAKLTIDEANGWLSVKDDIVWFGDYATPIWTWFELPNDAQTSSHQEWAVLTYSWDTLIIDLLKYKDKSWKYVRQDFAWKIEFYWAEVSSLVEWTWPNVLEHSWWHPDWFSTTLSNTWVLFDFAWDSWNDEWNVNLIDKAVMCPVTHTDVTLCKKDETWNYLTWWNLQLLWNLLETVSVPTNNNWNPVSSLTTYSTGNYVLQASGTYKYRTPDLNSDPNYSERLITDSSYFDSSFPWDFFPWVNVNTLKAPYTWYLWVMVNANPTNWSDYLAWDHKYSMWYPSYSWAFDFRVLDSWYTDNVGDLKVDIYNWYAWTTAENWCVTFKDVEYWTYNIDETLKYNWENVSGLWQVTVDQNNHDFTVVNHDLTPPTEIIKEIPWEEPVCSNWIYAKISINEASWWLDTIDDTIWLWDYKVNPWVWFKLPSDVATSSKNQWIVFTYTGNTVTVDLLKRTDETRQDFAWKIEFYWAEVDSIETWTWFYKLEDLTTWKHLDTITSPNINSVDIDFAVDVANDEWRITINDKPVLCTTDVVVCKKDDNNNYLSWWNLQLLWSHLDTINVTSDWVPTSTPVYGTWNYVLVWTGTYKYREYPAWTILVSDTTYTQRDSSDYWVYFDSPWAYSPWENIIDFKSPYEWYLWVMVNSNPTSWSDYLAWDHKYAIWFPGYSWAFDLAILDNNYPDNVGGLQVDVYNWFAWTTGENGCITFKDVPYGTYNIDETLKYSWTNVSWLWNVNVNENNNNFVVVNHQTPITIDNELKEAEPVCEDGWKYAKINVDDLNTVDWTGTVWFGDYKVPLWKWFKLPSGTQTSSHQEWAVLTYDWNKITVDLLKASNNSKETFAWTIELYWVEVDWSLVKWRLWDSFYKLESTDIFNSPDSQTVNFDFLVTTANDEWSFSTKDKVEYCHEPFKIVAKKIVCDDETDLPNNFSWALSHVTQNTADRWLSVHPNCKYEDGWSFQYGINDAIAPNWSFTWETTWSWWTTFWPTDSSWSIEYTFRHLDWISKIKVREVLKDWYIPFTDWQWDNPDVSAEIYCWSDITNYDNQEWLQGDDLWYWKTAYCIAWNVKEKTKQEVMCQNDYSVNNSRDISTIDLLLGNQINVGKLLFPSSAAAIDPFSWNVYYIEAVVYNPRLWYYDVNTNTNTVVWNLATYGNLYTKLSFDTTWTLYAITDYKNSSLYTVDKNTAIATFIAENPLINEDWWDLVFDDKLDLYVIVKKWKLFKVDILWPSSTNVTYIWEVKYNWNTIASTWLSFKDWKFYVTDNAKNLYSFVLTDLENAIKVYDNTNFINDLASCPVPIIPVLPQEPKYWKISWIIFNDLDKNWVWDDTTEPTLTWWTVTLTSTDSWSLSFSWVTDADWHYSFGLVPVWNYKVCEVINTSWIQSYPNTTDKCHQIVVTDTTDDKYDFGNYFSVTVVPTWGGGWTPVAWWSTWWWTGWGGWGWVSSWWGGGWGGWSQPPAKKLTTFDVWETVEWTSWPQDPDNGWIVDLYKDYLSKKKQLKDIDDEETVEWTTQIEKLPDELPKTWTDLSKRVTFKDIQWVELHAPKMTSSYDNSIDYWKSQLPEQDRNADEYLVIPSNWLVIPIVYVEKKSSDYQTMVNWWVIEYNNYLKDWALTYPWTDTADYWDAWNRVIFWHSSNWVSEEWRYKTQFQKIIELDEWEKIWVYKKDENGDYTRYIYVVNKSYQTHPSDVWILNPWKWSNLTLVTCTPIWWTVDRWIVKAKYENENKLELENYLYWKSISFSLKIKIDKIVANLSKMDTNIKKEKILELFNRLPDSSENKNLESLLKYLKLKLAIEYNS